MPKRIADNEKRVKLNCFVAPLTMERIKGQPGSQGEVVDRAMMVLVGAEPGARIDAPFPPAARRLSRRDQEVAARAASDLTAQKAGREGIDYSDVESTPTQHIATLDAVSPSAGSAQGKASLEQWRATRRPLLKPSEQKGK